MQTTNEERFMRAPSRFRRRIAIVALLGCIPIALASAGGGPASVPTATVRVVDGKKEGVEVEKRGDGTVREYYTWVAGKRQGSYRSYWDNGWANWDGQYDDDVKSGAWTEHNSDGELMWETPYVKGKRHGVEKHYYNDSDPRNNPERLSAEVNYVEGLKHGLTTEYWSNGQKSAQGSYENDLRQGQWNFWVSSGKSSGSKVYDKGKVVSETK